MQIARAGGLALAGIVAAGAVATWAMTRSRDGDGPQPDAPSPTPTSTTPPPTPTSATPPPTPTTQPVLEPTPPTTTTTTTTTDPEPAPAIVELELVATRTYTVRAGDTLSAIARRFGTTVPAIAELNGIADPNRIRVGQQLRIPGAGAVPGPAPAPTPAPTPDPTPPPGSPPPAEGGGRRPHVPPGPAISRVDGAGKRVALTFDDGPNGATTDAIVATLNRHGVDATFFVVGSNASRDGARLARMHRDGHVIANHSWSHPQLTALSNAQVRSQLADTNAAIRRATGTAPDIFRPPYGARSANVDSIARELGLRDVIWDVDTRDWARPGSDAIVRSAVQDARNGSIILMHDGGGNREQTAAALDRVIRGLEARGFELVTVPQLVAAGSS